MEHIREEAGAKIMDAAKNFPLITLIFLVGVVMTFISAIGQVDLFGLKIGPMTDWSRIVLGAAGIAAIGFSIDREFFAPKRALQSDGKPLAVSGPAVVKAAAFFQTLDDREQQSFPSLSNGANRIRILARTIVNLASQYQKIIENMARQGVKIEILLVDPNSESAKYLYGANYEVYKGNVVRSLNVLASLQKKFPDNVEIKFFPYVPTVGIICYDKDKSDSSLVQVQLYFLHGAIGRDRPVFTISKGDMWYDVFNDEFNSIWNTLPLMSLSDQNLQKILEALK
jgi:hypothetical protein